MDTMNIRYTSLYMYTKPRFLQYMFYVYAAMVSRIIMYEDTGAVWEREWCFIE